MNRFLLLTFLTLLSVFGAKAEIHFEHLTLAEAIAKAKQEKKPLFIDVFAVWCGPCKHMAATAFVDEQVAELYNAHFINVKIDGEKNDGPSVMQQFGITAFPTLLYLSPDGTLIHKSVGMLEAPALIRKANDVVHPEASPVFQARKNYYGSKRSKDDLRTYLAVMLEQQSDSLDWFAQRYYTAYKTLDMADQLDFYVFYKQENDVNSANSQAFLENTVGYPNDVYTGKIRDWINNAFGAAIQQHDFRIVSDVIDKVYPYWEKAENLGQDKTGYTEYVKKEYERYVN